MNTSSATTPQNFLIFQSGMNGMLIARSFVLVILSCTLLTACVSVKSFVDPSVPKVSYEEILKRPEPLRLKLMVEFQRNGEPYPKADSTLKDNAERVLRGTGLIVPAEDKSVGEIKVILNNIADRGQAAAKGFGTGLTFGLVGSTVMDAYEMTVSITTNGKTVTRVAIKHALYSAVGNTNLPPGVEALPPSVAFGRVLEQMLLRALQEMQAAGELSLNAVPESLPWGQG